jgi:hypothetical protein
METEAAQGERRLHADTAVRRGSLLKEHRALVAAAQAQGVSTPTERPGRPTTALVGQGGEHTAMR